MEASKRIVVNTLVQYGKALTNICLSLYSTRLIWSALGASDYGIYAVVGGVVAMLGFLQNALVVTTQRHISFSHGRNDAASTRRMFSSSMVLHAVLALLLAGVLLSLRSVIVNVWLTIPADRIDVAMTIYLLTVAMLFVNMNVAPLKAAFIARENIIYISLVEVADGLLKVGGAVLLLNATSDRLMLYGWLMLGLQIVNYLAFALYAFMRFPECRIPVHRTDVDRNSICQLLGFGGWTVYGMGAVVLRSQGLAVLLNHYFGSIMSAAWGIGYQVFGAVAFVSTSVINAMNPQIMKAEGAAERQRMLTLAARESKFSTLMLLVVTLPLLMEMPSVLMWWLGEVPPYATLFCRAIILGLIIDQSTFGLNTAVQATGRLHPYMLIMYTPKLLILPVAWLLLARGASPYAVMALYLVVELAVALGRLPYVHSLCDLSVGDYVRSVLLPLLPVALSEVAVSWFVMSVLEHSQRFMLTGLLAFAVGGLVLWTVALTSAERYFLLSLFHLKSRRP